MRKAKIILLVVQLVVVLVLFLAVGSSFVPGMEYVDIIFWTIQKWLDRTIWNYLIFIIINFAAIVIIFFINWAIRRWIFEIKFRKKYSNDWKKRFKNFI